MFKKCLTAVLMVGAIVGTPSAQDAKGVIANVSRAMGYDGLKTIDFSGPASEYSFGQAYIAGQAWPVWKNKTFTRTIDFDTPGMKIDRVQEPVDPQRKGGGLQPGATQTVVVNANTAWAQQLPIWLNPPGFLKAAANATGATVKSETLGGKKFTVVSFVAPNKAKMNGYIDERNMLDHVETWIDNAMLGDTPYEATYGDYKDFGGVKFPTRLVEKQGGFPTLELTVIDVKTNLATNIQAPQGRGGAGGGGGAAPGGGATSQKLADGVYLILPVYAALAVDFKDYIVIVEGPQSEARASAIITEAKRLIPNKPIRYIVNTHIHFDHSSGLRTFVAEGATILTHGSNKSYIEKIFAMPHTLGPDKLAQSKSKLNIETMGDKKVLTDGNHVIELHRLKDSLHNDGLIVAYLPKEKILVEADAFNPPAQADAPAPTTVNPNNTNLVDNINRLKLVVDAIVPVHYPADGRKVTMAELQRAIGGTRQTQ